MAQQDERELETECLKCGCFPLTINFKTHKIYCEDCTTEYKLEVV